MTAASVGVNRPVRSPPRMSTGAANAQEASLSAGQNAGFGSLLWSTPKPCLKLRKSAGMMSSMQARIPGMTPPTKSAGTVADGTSTL